MCVCVPPEPLQRLMGKRNNVAETQHPQKKTGIDTEAEEFSVLQCHTTIKPHGLSPGITAEPPKCILSLLQSLWGRGGLGAAQSQRPEKLSLSRNPTNESPISGYRPFGTKTGGFSCTRHEGECRKQEQGEGKRKEELNRCSQKVPVPWGSSNKQQKTWKQQEKEWMGSAKKSSLL